MRHDARAASRAAPGPGTQGTMGGPAPTSSVPGRRAVVLGDEIYLWLLVFAEVGIIAWLRATLSRYHGG